MPTDALSRTFAALADPTRRAILARLAAGECSVTELAEPFDMSLPAISKHLRVLEGAGLVARRAEAQFRHCRLEPERLQDAVDWAAHYIQRWRGRMDRLDAHLQRMQTKESRHARTSRRQ
ncbi:MAG: ArsR/SmtB family transcription factor [Vicinamibacterales bacterium]